MEPTFTALLATAVESIGLLRSGWSGLAAARELLRKQVTQEQYKFFRAAQRKERRQYAILAHQLSMNANGRGVFLHAPLLAEQNWVASTPLALAPPSESLGDDGGQFVTTFAKETTQPFLSGPHQSPAVSKRKKELLPALSKAPAYRPELHAVIQGIDQPPTDLFISRPSYSLSRIRTHDRYELSFVKAHYFDYIDCGELMAYELVLESLLLEDHGAKLDDISFLSKLEAQLTLRKSLGGWSNVQLRPSLAGVNVLTIFVDRQSRVATFPMMQRSAKTGSASSTVHVIPAGEFQPTTEADTSWDAHCTLWQTILREFAEEVLLDDEAKSHGQEMTQLARRPPIAVQLQLIRDQQWKTYFLGVGLDPLTLKPELLLVSVIDKDAFIAATGSLLPGGRLPPRNAEGEIVGKYDGWGEPVTHSTLRRYRDGAATLPAASGCIELFQRHADRLLGFSII